MARLIDRVRQDQVPAVFCETGERSAATRSREPREVGLVAVSLWIPCQMTTVLPTLLDLHRHNVKLIRAGLGSPADPTP